MIKLLLWRIIRDYPRHRLPTYTQWFRDDPGFDFLRSMEQSSCAIAIMAFDKATFDGDLKVQGLLITNTEIRLLQRVLFLIKNGLKQRLTDKIVLRVFIGKPGQ